MKICKKCKDPFELSNFYASYEGKNGTVYSATCKPCNKKQSTQYRRKNKHKDHEYEIKYKYGISADEYQNLLKVQDNKCAICNEFSKKRLAVDHCHKTGKIRGLLCFACNTAIGKLKEDVNLINNAIEYLRKNA